MAKRFSKIVFAEKRRCRCQSSSSKFITVIHSLRVMMHRHSNATLGVPPKCNVSGRWIFEIERRNISKCFVSLNVLCHAEKDLQLSLRHFPVGTMHKQKVYKKSSAIDARCRCRGSFHGVAAEHPLWTAVVNACDDA